MKTLLLLPGLIVLVTPLLARHTPSPLTLRSLTCEYLENPLGIDETNPCLGKLNSDQSVHVEYKGDSLTSGLNCYWKVRVWDKNGNPSSWSEPARWTMGLLEKKDWTAQWIG